MNLIKTYIATAIGLALGIALFLLAGGISLFSSDATSPELWVYFAPFVLGGIGLAVDVFVRKKKVEFPTS